MSDPVFGRTARQLAALPDGSFYLVPHMHSADHCRRLLSMLGRDSHAIRFVTPDATPSAIRAARVRVWDVGHVYFGAAGPRGFLAYDLLGTIARTAPLSQQKRAAA